jgi:hypothetical protein
MICDDCAKARKKHNDPELLECKLREIQPVGVMIAYYAFIVQKGVIEEPFRLVCDCNKHPEHAWPFQFHPVIVRECDGYEKRGDS